MARTVPVSATKAPAQLITGALWNAGPKATGDFMLSVPVFRGRQSASQNLVNNTWVSLNLNVTDVDSESGHSNVTNNSRYVCQVPGWYWCEGYFATSSGVQARVAAAIAKNGSRILGAAQSTLLTADLQALSGAAAVQLAVGDYVEVQGYQNTGGTLATFDGSDLCPSLNTFWIHS